MTSANTCYHLPHRIHSEPSNLIDTNPPADYQGPASSKLNPERTDDTYQSYPLPDHKKVILKFDKDFKWGEFEAGENEMCLR